MQVRPFDIEQIRADFPILGRKVYGKYPLVYLDNAATTQKPRMVVESMVEEYYNVNANVHRGVHFLSQQATDLHEQSRSVSMGMASMTSVIKADLSKRRASGSEMPLCCI